MRIRKNAKLSPLLHTCSSSLLQNGSFPVQTHVCQLNQSPWDVIPFHSNNSIQFQDEPTFKTENFHTDESVAAMMDTEHVLEEDNTDKVVNINNNGADKDLKSHGIVAGPPRRARGRPKKTVGLSSNNNNNNNNEFYYYSGFGPLWGKRRGDSDNKNGGITLGLSEDKVNVGVNVDSCYSEMDYVDDYDYDDYSDDDNGKRRMRKPVKERSLKSLM
ncbi:uncharacterized protein LOC131651853 [Vicia villosa]|uniref:uncharacterized protein LOC131651853 n=1 Tax=Vicia villosa TaxID=3911 RepID=UPI00273A9A97|nr:uncharacterized protein LOC131651853 [Vicia villosa]